LLGWRRRDLLAVRPTTHAADLPNRGIGGLKSEAGRHVEALAFPSIGLRSVLGTSYQARIARRTEVASLAITDERETAPIVKGG
jgi:hypothetical protein